jgi:hypothetical protein
MAVRNSVPLSGENDAEADVTEVTVTLEIEY